jgi:AraC-like DNA-binding protein/uncharacterized cupin superfamily protein
MSSLVRSPLNPDWLIPQGWEHILGAKLDYRLGNSALHLWGVQLNEHAETHSRSALHAHPRHQLLYYQRGSGQLRAGDQSYAVAQGSVFLLPAQCSHQFSRAPQEDAPAVCLAIDFTIDQSAYAEIDLQEGLPMESELAVLLSLVHTKTARPFQIRTADQQLVDRCIRDIVEENQQRELGYAALIQAHLLRLIALCLRATQRAQGFERHFRHTAWRHHLVAQRATAILEQNATRQPEITLAEIARLCGASRNHLNQILKNQTGATFHQALLKRRLEIARGLLEQGRLNCTEAALESGFNDSNYFSRAFRKAYGHPPSVLVGPN